MSFPVFEALFGSKVRARLIRFFILNPSEPYPISDISEKTLLPKAEVSREVRKLAKSGMLREVSRKRMKAYQIHPEFPFFTEIKGLVVKSNSDVPKQMFRQFRTAGDVRLILIGGLFVNDPKGKADLVLVVNNVNRVKLLKAMEKLEAEIGQEVRFVLMDTDELGYRLNMLDRFLIEFLEGPYQEILNRISGFKRTVAGIRR